MEKRDTLQQHGVKMGAVCSNSRAAIQWTANLESGPGQRLARRINSRTRNLLAHGMATWIHCVPRFSSISRNQEADSQVNISPHRCGSPMTERAYTSTSNKAEQISKKRSAATGKWDDSRGSKHFNYRLTDKARNKGPIPGITRAQSLASKFYWLQSGHVATGVYLNQISHRDDDKCWWCVGKESHISKMYSTHWKPPGVSERMWSVNLNASISGEYKTLEGHSCQPSAELGAPARSLGAPWSNLRPHVSAGDTPLSTGRKSGSTSNHSRAVWEKYHLLWEHWWGGWKS